MNEITNIPNHIAIIQDGNRRYAKIQGQNTSYGHRKGAQTSDEVLEWAQEIGIRNITLYSFSTENFNRPDTELNELFSLFIEKFKSIKTDTRVHSNEIRLQVVGDRSLIPEDMLKTIEEAEEATKDYAQFHLNIALAYGGRNEIVRAVKEILQDLRQNKITPDMITTDLLDNKIRGDLHLPPVDLIIRTGNEKRTSNFLPWFANGYKSAVYFCAPYWPLFRKIDLLRGIRVYDERVKSGYFP
ncbi:polyprenyl diphosphate synthase [Methanogenium organophilum]|uniref:Tritrans,polycis-undecaprenyl-diphosphate synthase (geranylgeranyl-diphosphate specific) n=1 Tax=Methanogenium organophilum TaxID=2199 RepID=A0A9X9S3V4_METOG|nr:polyprenyl diphosphate synthase [Methanogenium organophilum]WAI01293.1 polyprenyl diphosphate synthase [Methanogenium organophilum]